MAERMASVVGKSETHSLEIEIDEATRTKWKMRKWHWQRAGIKNDRIQRNRAKNKKKN